ncbi:MAG: hypothetical protein LDLANPLL_00019 [Turneriella sp.]|nr:hypothetical protein [Turneriella sp.]
MVRIVIACLLVLVFACASKTRRNYPDNGGIVYFDMNAGDPNGNVDTMGVMMYYKGPLSDTIEDLGVVSGKVSGRGKRKNDVLKELQKEAQNLKADGIYQIEYHVDGDTLSADGYAFRFK